MYVRRLEQFKPTEENINELRETFEAVAYVYLLKKAEYENDTEGKATKDST